MSLIAIDWHPGEKQLRTFGVICGVGCVALGAWAMRRQVILGFPLNAAAAIRVAIGLQLAAAAVGALAWRAPRILRPLYVALTAITLPVGYVLSYVVLGILFYAVLTPYGLLFRLLGRDALTRRFDPAAPSYWVERPRVTDNDRYYHQY